TLMGPIYLMLTTLTSLYGGPPDIYATNGYKSTRESRDALSVPRVSRWSRPHAGHTHRGVLGGPSMRTLNLVAPLAACALATIPALAGGAECEKTAAAAHTASAKCTASKEECTKYMAAARKSGWLG